LFNATVDASGNGSSWGTVGLGVWDILRGDEPPEATDKLLSNSLRALSTLMVGETSFAAAADGTSSEMVGFSATLGSPATTGFCSAGCASFLVLDSACSGTYGVVLESCGEEQML